MTVIQGVFRLGFGITFDYSEGMEMLRFFWDEAIALDPASDGRHERHRPFLAKSRRTMRVETAAAAHRPVQR